MICFKNKLLLLLLGYAAGRQLTPAGRTGLMVSLEKTKKILKIIIIQELPQWLRSV